MRKTLLILLSLLFVLNLLSACSEDKTEIVREGMMTITLEMNDEPLINPYKGWIAYGYDHGSFEAQKPITWKFASLGYCRFSWSDIETADGVYNWDAIEKSIAQIPAGKQYAFGIMACNPSSRDDYCTPKFICDRDDVNVMEMQVNLNATGEFITLHVVDYRDPGEGYYKKVEQLAKALAEKYGNDKRIAYIDIRSFGSWGENSYSQLEIGNGSKQDGGLDIEVMRRCWQIYIDAFKGCDTRLVTAWGFGCDNCSIFCDKEVFLDAVAQGVGVRRDGYGDLTCAGDEVLWCLNKAVSVLEMPGGFANVSKNGFNAERMIKTLNENRACYVPIGAYSDSENMIHGMESSMLEVTNSIGYHFVLEDATVSRSLGIGEKGKIRMRWTNDGNAKIFNKVDVKLALLDETNAVVAECTLDGVDPKNWVCKRDLYTENETNIEEAEFSFAADKSLKYKLALGISTGRDANPDIKIGNSGMTENGWYILYDEFAENAQTSSLEKIDDNTYLFDAGKSVSADALRIAYGAYIPENVTVSASEDNVNFTEGGTGRYFKIILNGKKAAFEKAKHNMFDVEPLLVSEGFTVSGDHISAETNGSKVVKYNLVQPLEIGGSGKYDVTFKAKLTAEKEMTCLFSYELRGSGDHKDSAAWYSNTLTARATVKIAPDGEWHDCAIEADLPYTGCIEICRASISFVETGDYTLEISDFSMIKQGDENGELAGDAYVPADKVVIESVQIA